MVLEKDKGALEYSREEIKSSYFPKFFQVGRVELIKDGSKA